MNAGRAVTTAITLTLAGCASLAPGEAREEVAVLTRDRAGVALERGLGVEAPADPRIGDLLNAPLAIDTAVDIALASSPAVGAIMAELDAADAERVQSLRLANPSFTFSSKRNSETRSIERAVMVNVLSILTMPLAERASQHQFEGARLRAAARAVEVAAEVRVAWIDAVASHETLRYVEQVQLAAEAASELARRMQAAGNFSALARMREHAFAADAAVRLARARSAALADRERLTRLLGLSGPGAGYSLPDRLPPLPGGRSNAADLEARALAERLDLRLARREAEARREALELLRATRFVNLLHAGYVNESDSGEPRKSGYEIEIELPLFDPGDAKVARAEALYRASLARVTGLEAEARSEIRQEQVQHDTALAIARHYRDEIVPLRKRISDETLLRYNGMLIGVFELLADARGQIDSVTAAIDATREYWRSDVRLSYAIAAGSPRRTLPVSSGAVAMPAGAAPAH